MKCTTISLSDDVGFMLNLIVRSEDPEEMNTSRYLANLVCSDFRDKKGSLETEYSLLYEKILSKMDPEDHYGLESDEEYYVAVGIAARYLKDVLDKNGIKFMRNFLKKIMQGEEKDILIKMFKKSNPFLLIDTAATDEDRGYYRLLSAIFGWSLDGESVEKEEAILTGFAWGGTA